MKLLIRLCLLSLIVGSSTSHAFVAFCRAFGEDGGMAFLMVTCPATSIKKVDRKIEKKGKWRAYRVGARANFLLGGRAGIAINHNLDICSIVGISAGTIGASVGAIEISMDKDS